MKENVGIFLVGMPGCGKSTFGKSLSEFLGINFVDMDSEIEKRSGKRISEIFDTAGEAYFRRVEKELLGELTASREDIVVSTGGGVVCDRENRNMLHSVNAFYLEADIEELFGRIAADGDVRPLIKETERDLKKIYEERSEMYGEFPRFVLNAAWRENPGRHIARFLYAFSRDIRGLSALFPETRLDHPDAIVKPFALTSLGENLGENPEETYFITCEAVDRIYGELLPGNRAVFPDGEDAKTPACLERIWSELLSRNYNRNQTLVSVGGGTITDLGGFAASTYKRGIRFKSVPTTLLAQVDAAIGGKNGINYGRVKNMVGTFYLPETVLIDPLAVLSTDSEEIINGLVEGLKVCLVVHEDEASLYDRLETAGRIAVNPVLPDLERFVIKSVQDKLGVIKSDYKENGMRKFLNLGHTFGHAFEMKYGLSHGVAVALGMIKILEGNQNGTVCDYLGFLKKIVSEHLGIMDGGTDAELIGLMSKDKKNDSAEITFVKLDSPGHPFLERIGAEEIANDGKNKRGEP